MDITQERFLYDRLAGQDPGPTTWKVPVSVITSDSRSNSTRPYGKFQSCYPWRIQNQVESRWTKVNPGQTGFYRVRYSPDALSPLLDAASSFELPPTDRLGLQSDLFALVRAGMEPATRYLDLVGAYKAETDATVWTDLSTNLRELEVLLADHPSLDQLRAFNKTVYEDIASRLGWEESPGEGHLDALLRTTVLARAGGLGNESVLEEARDRFQESLRDPASLRADIRGVVYSLVALDADRDLYDTLWDMEKKATLQEEKRRLLGAVSRPGTRFSYKRPLNVPSPTMSVPRTPPRNHQRRRQPIRPGLDLGLRQGELVRVRPPLRQGRLHDHAPRLHH